MKFRNVWKQLKTSQKDSLKAILLVLIAYMIVLKINIAEMLAEKLEAYEEFQLDEVPFLLLFVAIALAWFAWRRMNEQIKEMALRKLAEEKSEKLLLENKSLTQHILKVQEYERLELARDLHDDIGQYLLAIRLDASTLALNDGVDNPARRILSNAGHIQSMARSLMRRLRPAPTNSKSCVDGIHLMVQEWQEQQPNIDVVLHIQDGVALFSEQCAKQYRVISEQVSVTLYRFVQESLTNIAKHAQANHVDISLNLVDSKTDNDAQYLCLEIKDDGNGFDGQTISSGMGMIGMRERISAVGGEFFVSNNTPKGLIVRAKIPIHIACAE